MLTEADIPTELVELRSTRGQVVHRALVPRAPDLPPAIIWIDRVFVRPGLGRVDYREIEAVIVRDWCCT